MKNTPTLSLHVPEPKARPGDPCDFSHIALSEPGAIGRPDIHAKALETVEQAYGLIRVLDKKGKAVGPWNPKADPETLKRGLKAMILT
ncbi:MAG: 3-methyl-2-oxobutanoate dehydrogenase (2-methylpropanoyl-transferring) subunit alpha, partial [Caulobacteraceae bacterium]